MIPTSGNVKMAVDALRSARYRSLLTMLGIMIGIVSVVTVVSLGEGLKRGLVGQISQHGRDLISIHPGRPVSREGAGLTGFRLLGPSIAGSLNERDLEAISQTDGVIETVPLSFVAGTAVKDGLEYDQGAVVGTSQEMSQVLRLDLEYGTFFSDEDANKNGAVIGKWVAEQLFGENVPVGKLFTIRGKVFVVRGVFKEFESSPLAPGADYNSMIAIPYETGKQLNQNVDIYQIFARVAGVGQIDQIAADIQTALVKTREGHHDFTVLTPEESMAAADEVLNLLTTFIAGIAAISLVVAGIGIMNIMLVSVTERTHEIGVRKAIGATGRQLLGQFLTEAVILSLGGGLLGVIFALLTNFLFRIFTDLTPVLTWPIMSVSVLIAVSVGVIFGITPALKAARKHPIDALRHD